MDESISKFYVLQDKCLKDSGIVAHVSLTAFSALVSYTRDPYCAILFTHQEANAFRTKLEKIQRQPPEFDVVEFHSLFVDSFDEDKEK